MGVSHPPVSRRSVGNTSKQPYFHLSACRRSSRAGIQSAIQGEWVFTRRIEDCAKPKAPGVSQAAQLGREEGHPHPPSVAFKSFSDGLELPALPTEEELPRAIEAFDQARNRLHTAQLKAKSLGIT